MFCNNGFQPVVTKSLVTGSAIGTKHVHDSFNFIWAEPTALYISTIPFNGLKSVRQLADIGRGYASFLLGILPTQYVIEPDFLNVFFLPEK